MATELETSIAEQIKTLYPDLEFKFVLVRDEFDVMTVKGRQGNSVYSVSFTRNRFTFTTEYRQGAAYRVYCQMMHNLGISTDRPTKKRVNLQAKLNYDEQQALKHSVPINPTMVGVLYCLVQDASAVVNGELFEDFCGEFGYDTDSRSAEKAFLACRDTYHALKRLGLDLETLSELFKDY